MKFLTRHRGRGSHRRPSLAQYDLEVLEGRAMLSGLGAGLFGSQATPQATRVPTVITLQSGAPSVEAGQSLPLIATVGATGTARELKAAQSEPIAGTIEFLVDSPHPILLGKVAINSSDSSTPSIVSSVDSIFGIASHSNSASVNDTAYLWTKALKAVGPYQIEARFAPANADYRASTSAPVAVTIAPRTHDAPTVLTVQAPTSSVETGAAVPLNVTVRDSGSDLAGGVVKLTTVSPHPAVLGKISVGVFNQPIPFATDKLQGVGTHQVQAVYVPGTN